uniref:Uncharacterized protein n=1 Tax=Rhizophora mucronata TaxID=61149 RepID=A0A2P2Q0M4_RHIMU
MGGKLFQDICLYLLPPLFIQHH